MRIAMRMETLSTDKGKDYLQIKDFSSYINK